MDEVTQVPSAHHSFLQGPCDPPRMPSAVVRCDRAKHPYQHPYEIAPCDPKRLTQRKSCQVGTFDADFPRIRYAVPAHILRPDSCSNRANIGPCAVSKHPYPHPYAVGSCRSSRAGRPAATMAQSPSRCVLRAVSRAQIGRWALDCEEPALGVLGRSFTRSHTHFDLLAGTCSAGTPPRRLAQLMTLA